MGDGSLREAMWVKIQALAVVMSLAVQTVAQNEGGQLTSLEKTLPYRVSEMYHVCMRIELGIAERSLLSSVKSVGLNELRFVVGDCAGGVCG